MKQRKVRFYIVHSMNVVSCTENNDGGDYESPHRVDLLSFSERIESLIKDGWELYGDMKCYKLNDTHERFAQALCWYED